MRQNIQSETEQEKMMMEEMDECLMNQVNYTEIIHPEPESLYKYKLDDLFLNFD